MKKFLSLFLATVLMFACVMVSAPTAKASAKTETSRTIAIVFDNSGSMYISGNQAWCRATYAMEVFASMLNQGDVLQIYPMHPIEINGSTYSMQSPFVLTDSSQASAIREIYTEDAGGTPIESIDCAIEGLNKIQGSKKYMIILTDGGTFYKNDYGLSKERTIIELDKRIQANAGPEMTIMYLGIGSSACIPSAAESDYFVKEHAANTADVLSTLTEMCNLVFGRDTLPKNRISGNTINFDISMSKLIVFVQGDDISDLKVTSSSGSSVGTLVGSQQTKYSTKGTGDYTSVPDTSLQGMMVTYSDCLAGSYNIEYSGTATSVEIYYEPNADLDFVFTDSKGNTVDPTGLYEGDYKVSFGMKDAKTGKLITSDLLGNPHYEGSYSINGQEVTFTHDGHSGEVPITLKTKDTFEANLTVTYLSGYTISKSSEDFGWPEGGVQVVAPPLGEFQMKLTVPQDYIVIKELDQTKTITVDLSIDGRKLTAEEFQFVKLKVDCGGVEYTLTPKAAESQYLIQLKSTDGIAEGNYQVSVEAHYEDNMDRKAHLTDSSRITLSNTPLWVKWAIGLLSLLLLFIIIWLIAHIRVLPKHLHTTRNSSSMIFDGDPVTDSTSFLAEINKKSMKSQCQYGGRKFGVTMDVTPGKDSYLYKSDKQKSAEVKVASLKKFGPAKVQEVMIGSVKYVYDEEVNKIIPAIPNQKPFLLKNGMIVKYSGTIQDAGIDKDFEVISKLNFKKK